MSAEDELIDELTRLRHGRGLQDGSLRRRIGRHIRRLCGLSGEESERDIRAKVHGWLTALIADLPDELARSAELGFAMDRVVRFRRLTDRVEQLATELSWSTRTARRRIEEVTKLVARAALAQGAGTDPETGWRLRSLWTLLRLDTVGPELHETRVVVAERSGLSRIAVRLSVPAAVIDPSAPRDVVAEVAYGARIVETEHWFAGQHYRWTLELPSPLASGAAHQFQMIYRLGADRPTRPHYALLPLVQCDHFEVRVKFPIDQRPALIWRLDGLPPRLLDDDQPGRSTLELDDAGEVQLAFTDLRQGRGYGLKWLAPAD